jgi:hypothetical protein
MMTTLKVMTIAATLSLAPGLALAMCSGSKMQQAQSCAAGTTWDSSSQACVPVVNS